MRDQDEEEYQQEEVNPDDEESEMKNQTRLTI